MLTKPLISCIMPTYGRPEFLGEAVAMFLAQDYPEAELVLLNDCVGQDFQCSAPRVRVVNAAERYPTLGEKRNAAIEMAAGQVIAVWDDDDIHLPWRLSFSYREMQRWRTEFYRPSAFLSYWGEEQLRDDHVIPSWVSHGVSMFTKDLWRRVGGYPARDVGEDSEFFARIHQELNGEFIKYPISPKERFYVMRGTSHYKHMSISGGAHELDTMPCKIEIEPRPVQDPRLREACLQLTHQYYGKMIADSPFDAPSATAEKPLLSICVSIKNRSCVAYPGGELLLFPHCVKSIAAAARELSSQGWIELMVADYASTDWPLREWLSSAAEGLEVRILPVQGAFSRGAGLNLAAQYAQGETLLLFDADMLVTADFLQDCLRKVSAHNALFPVMRLLDEQGDEAAWQYYSYGISVMHKSLFEKSGGVPEFHSWGGEDDIFYERVSRIVPVVREQVSGLRHQWHTEKCRHEHYVRPRKSDYEEFSKQAQQGINQQIHRLFWAEHPYWKGYIHLIDGERMKRPEGDGGAYELREGECLILRWDRWPPETLLWDEHTRSFIGEKIQFYMREEVTIPSAR